MLLRSIFRTYFLEVFGTLNPQIIWGGPSMFDSPLHARTSIQRWRHKVQAAHPGALAQGHL